MKDLFKLNPYDLNDVARTRGHEKELYEAGERKKILEKLDEIDRRLTELEKQKKEVIPSHEWMRKLEERIKALEDKRDVCLEFIVTQILLNKKVNESLTALEQSRPVPSGVMTDEERRRQDVLWGRNRPDPSEPEPARDGWIYVPHMVWRARKNTDGKWIVDLAQHGCLNIGDLWQPYDPQHPEPPSAPVKEKVE